MEKIFENEEEVKAFIEKDERIGNKMTSILRIYRDIVKTRKPIYGEYNGYEFQVDNGEPYIEVELEEYSRCGSSETFYLKFDLITLSMTYDELVEYFTKKEQFEVALLKAIENDKIAAKKEKEDKRLALELKKKEERERNREKNERLQYLKLKEKFEKS